MPIKQSFFARRPSAFVLPIALVLIAAACSVGFAGHARAQDFALVDLDGKPVDLDAYREDGKWTLFMIRYHGCGPCDEGERELQQWFSAQDEDKVSVLVLNIDEENAWDRTRERLESNRIGYPNAFTRDSAAVSAGPISSSPETPSSPCRRGCSSLPTVGTSTTRPADNSTGGRSTR